MNLLQGYLVSGLSMKIIKIEKLVLVKVMFLIC